MGEMADAILNGDFCQQCGEYCGEGEGYAVTCEDCQKEERNEKRRLQQRKISTRNGKGIVLKHLVPEKSNPSL